MGKVGASDREIGRIEEGRLWVVGRWERLAWFQSGISTKQKPKAVNGKQKKGKRVT